MRKAKPHGSLVLSKKIGEALASLPIHLLVNSKVFLNNRLKESIKQSWHFKKSLHKQGKLQRYINEHPGFENYLNLPNQKLRASEYRKRNETLPLVLR